MFPLLCKGAKRSVCGKRNVVQIGTVNATWSMTRHGQDSGSSRRTPSSLVRLSMVFFSWATMRDTKGELFSLFSQNAQHKCVLSDPSTAPPQRLTCLWRVRPFDMMWRRPNTRRVGRAVLNLKRLTDGPPACYRLCFLLIRLPMLCKWCTRPAMRKENKNSVGA